MYIADPRNKRIQIFDASGTFLGKWSIPEWGEPYGFEDLAIDSNGSRLYTSSAHMDAVLIFNLNGTRLGGLKPKLPDKLEGVSALALVNQKLYVMCTSGNRVSQIDLQKKE